MSKDKSSMPIADTVRELMKMESAGGILLGSIILAILAYLILHLSLPRAAATAAGVQNG